MQEQRGQHQADTGHGTSGKNEGTVPSQEKNNFSKEQYQYRGLQLRTAILF